MGIIRSQKDGSTRARAISRKKQCKSADSSTGRTKQALRSEKGRDEKEGKAAGGSHQSCGPLLVEAGEPLNSSQPPSKLRSLEEQAAPTRSY